ncbi:hemin receptor [Pasteurella multocida subsp. multocida str. Anand1_goat]|nr:hemin receptor [Pasteurella multocida subsp. multocida str. Anand1_goat]
MINQTRVGGIITLNHLFQEMMLFNLELLIFTIAARMKIFKTRGG